VNPKPTASCGLGKLEPIDNDAAALLIDGAGERPD
jgi:hypothetical protein